MAVRTAVIPAAGMGTRFLPATRATPKELLPIYDTPALQFVIDEAAQAGCTRVVIVTSRAKPSIESYASAASTDKVAVSVVYQDSPLGLGHAVSCARQVVGDEPFVVMLPDEIMGDASLTKQLVALHEKSGKSSIGLKRVAATEVSSYGNVKVAVYKSDTEDAVEILQVVEKPKPADAVSDIVIIGRYVFSPNIFDKLEQIKPSANGELQLTDALEMLANERALLGVVSEITRYDTGTPMGLLRAVIEIALERKDVGQQLNSWLKEKFNK
ncbi:MAG: UTP--glucose-1-phosphate uridylyltransferase [Actinomycetota bacterium]|nr:UTP--glucose-1-phosphate uridylyltransferase [Actinomycetota bacterium]